MWLILACSLPVIEPPLTWPSRWGMVAQRSVGALHLCSLLWRMWPEAGDRRIWRHSVERYVVWRLGGMTAADLIDWLKYRCHRTCYFWKVFFYRPCRMRIGSFRNCPFAVWNVWKADRFSDQAAATRQVHCRRLDQTSKQFPRLNTVSMLVYHHISAVCMCCW